jgi:hypothetical protein
VTPETFVHEYWARKPLFVKGFADKCRGLFDGEAFSWALVVPGPPGEDLLRASFDAKTHSGTSAVPPTDQCSSSVFCATVEQAVPLFKTGATLCLSQVETRVPKLAPVLAAIKRQLSYHGKAGRRSRERRRGASRTIRPSPSLNDRLGPSCGERAARQDLEGAGPGRRVRAPAKRSRAWLRQPLPASDPPDCARDAGLAAIRPPFPRFAQACARHHPGH